MSQSTTGQLQARSAAPGHGRAAALTRPTTDADSSRIGIADREPVEVDGGLDVADPAHDPDVAAGQHEHGSMLRRERTAIILVRRVLAFLAATLALAVLLPAGTASAATSSSGGTLTGYASCNRYHHTMNMTASIVLSTRFPNGAPVATRYAYYYVSPTTQQRTSDTYTTKWLYSTAAASTRYVPETYFTAGYTLTNQASALPSYAINTWGHLKVLAQVGVWNGSSYEYSNWDAVGTYSNSGQFNIGPTYNSVCTASVS